MALPRSPLAPESVPRLPAIDGVRLATRACGIKYRGANFRLYRIRRSTTLLSSLRRS